MHALGFGLSDTGKVRDVNEDVFRIDNSTGVYVVSDGMGGHRAGEVASAAAVDGIKTEIEKRSYALKRFQSGEGDADALESFVRELVNAAGSRVYRLAVESAEHHGMGCTLTVLLQVHDKVAIGHVGDSRNYLLRAGAVHQLTRDHTLAREPAELGGMAPSEVKESCVAHVLTRAIGHQALSMPVVPGDRFLRCSDGLYGALDSDDALADRLGGVELSEIPVKLVEDANRYGGDDNITAVVVDIEGTEAERIESAGELEIVFGVLEADFLFQDLYLSQSTHVMNACRFETYPIRRGRPLSRKA